MAKRSSRKRAETQRFRRTRRRSAALLLAFCVTFGVTLSILLGALLRACAPRLPVDPMVTTDLPRNPPLAGPLRTPTEPIEPQRVEVVRWWDAVVTNTLPPPLLTAGTAAPTRPKTTAGAPTVTRPSLTAWQPLLAAEGLDVSVCPPAELRNYLDSHPVTASLQYEQSPSVRAPYAAGRLTDRSQQAAVNALNAIRLVAGVPPNVRASDDLVTTAQYAAVLLAKNGKLSHTPGQPADMPSAFYQRALRGTKGGNLAHTVGSTNVLLNDLRQFLDDSDSHNISTMGHRRWMLNPGMGATGFGHADVFTVMMATDRSNASAGAKHRVVAFPAQMTPTAYFSPDWAWTVSLDEGFDISGVSVLLVRRSDGRQWFFAASGSDGDFFRSNAATGQPRCVIFRPKGASVRAEDTYYVEVSGIRKGGKDYPLRYYVNFYAL
ncbi:MAG: CAP domain-containing protein [Oscillospiraceae bacterium]|jgi:uncharacterized protein YkwD|nr:CAP domain-containing protein [Oscillospiraceae bacterium]